MTENMKEKKKINPNDSKISLLDFIDSLLDKVDKVNFVKSVMTLEKKGKDTYYLQQDSEIIFDSARKIFYNRIKGESIEIVHFLTSAYMHLSSLMHRLCNLTDTEIPEEYKDFF